MNEKNRQIPLKYRLFLMLFPFIVLITLFAYLPLFGWRFAFFNYRPGMPLRMADFVGLDWFKSIVDSPARQSEVLRVMRNTLAISGLGIAVSWLPIAFAILLTELRGVQYKKLVQTLTTIPNFISWVMVYSFAFVLFSVDAGLVNRILMDLGLINQGINFLLDTDHIWFKMTLWGMWKGLGWGSIMYLAAIAGIDQELYEAARVDGAGRFRQIWHITVPGLLPTYFVLLMLSIANLVNNGMDQYYVFRNAMNKDTIEVLDLYVYNLGFGRSTTSGIPFATAVSMLKSVISLTLLFAANRLSKILRGERIF
ncbi:MAG: ABC transporter permease subunit [Treponema sp.]|jgi:putative aldouronate transport system permease protein|nr:ABC transporter permease subunit [Treponema sp.]